FLSASPKARLPILEIEAICRDYFLAVKIDHIISYVVVVADIVATVFQIANGDIGGFTIDQEAHRMSLYVLAFLYEVALVRQSFDLVALPLAKKFITPAVD